MALMRISGILSNLGEGCYKIGNILMTIDAEEAADHTSEVIWKPVEDCSHYRL